LHFVEKCACAGGRAIDIEIAGSRCKGGIAQGKGKGSGKSISLGRIGSVAVCERLYRIIRAQGGGVEGGNDSEV
jgi:hypothetical protein